MPAMLEDVRSEIEVLCRRYLRNILAHGYAAVDDETVWKPS